MTDQEIYEIVRALRLPPGVNFETVGEVQFGQPVITFDITRLEDGRSDTVKMPLSAFWTTYPGERFGMPQFVRPSTVREVAEIVRAAIAFLSQHEADEWLTMNGKRFRNPHPEAPWWSEYHQVWGDKDEANYVEGRQSSNASTAQLTTAPTS